MRGHNDQTLAVSRFRDGTRRDEAEVIDLVQLPLGTRPTPICGVEFDEVDRLREMDCDFYQSCLGFAAQVRWRSFHCRQCPRHPGRVARNPAAASAEPRPMPYNVIPIRED
ncbi:MAG: hypothetical protein AAF449_16535 [Myxococcota bacterium]